MAGPSGSFSQAATGFERSRRENLPDTAVLEELGGYKGVLPIPNSFPQEQEKQEFSYAFFSTGIGEKAPPAGRWTHGQSLDGNGEFSLFVNKPMGQVPHLATPPPEGYATLEQMSGDGKGIVDKIREVVHT